MVDNRVSIDAALYFKIKGSKMFGGKGSEGYIAGTYEDVKNINGFDFEQVEGHILDISKLCRVPKECVSVISKEDYEEATEDCDDEDD